MHVNCIILHFFRMLFFFLKSNTAMNIAVNIHQIAV